MTYTTKYSTGTEKEMGHWKKEEMKKMVMMDRAQELLFYF